MILYGWMRIFSLLVTRNEAHRYLKECLQWHSQIVDGIFVYDDRSTDDTVKIAREYATVVVRPSGPSFLEDEGTFRSLAWDMFAHHFLPTEEDVIFAVDADEFLISTKEDSSFREVCAGNAQGSNNSLSLHIPEVFYYDESDVYVRTDGFWGDLWQPRICRWSNNIKFQNKKMASGSLPEISLGNIKKCHSFALLHLGYARDSDRQEKFKRYSGLPGHNPAHVNSILQSPTLKKWDYAAPVLNFETVSDEGNI